MPEALSENVHIADILARVAGLLELKKESRYRIRSYRRAAEAIRDAGESMAELLLAGGAEGLRELRGVGPKLAQAIEEIVETGRLRLLERLEDGVAAEAPFTRVPGLGEEEAARIHDVLGIETLEDLELVAHDGRLLRVEGFGPQRVRQIRDALGQMLSRSAQRVARRKRERQEGGGGGDVPPVPLLLEIDAEYRAKTAAGELKLIAPRRFNPEGKRWLPIMKVRRVGWAFTALFSNTARAHELGTTQDWVVLYYKRTAGEDQCTVVTAGRRPLRGKRVVRGREDECLEHYEASEG